MVEVDYAEPLSTPYQQVGALVQPQAASATAADAARAAQLAPESSFGSSSQQRTRVGPAAAAGSQASSPPASACASSAADAPSTLRLKVGHGAADHWSRRCNDWLEAAHAAAHEVQVGALDTAFLEATLAIAGPPASSGFLDERLELSVAVSRRLGGSSGSSDCGDGCCVYQGLFSNAPVAVKVMHSGGNDQAKAVAHAMEMAVLSSVQHPSIVQAYACLPDMARLPDDTRSPAPTLTFRGLLPGEDAHGAAACDVLIMELCDRGTLRDALAAGALPAGPAAGAPWGVAVLLLDVAAGLHYLHSIGLAHGGVEAENVLLKTSADRDGPGVQAKLGGFGKARILPRLGGRGDPLEALSLAGGASHSTLVGADSAGSDGGLLSDGLVVVTASPGNCARCCSGGTPAASFAGDVYAFGALLLQTLDTCRGVPGPTSGPTRCAYSALAADCMAPAASFRPTMAAVAARLEAMA